MNHSTKAAPRLINVFGFHCLETRPRYECDCGAVLTEGQLRYRDDGNLAPSPHFVPSFIAMCPSCGRKNPRAIKQCEASGLDAEVCAGGCLNDAEIENLNAEAEYFHASN